MSNSEKEIACLQYLLDEGFIEIGYSNGKPSVFLATSLQEAKKAVKSMAKDKADWWKK